jgi:hypothetical protein
MKTLKITLLAIGFLYLNTAFSFTALNLPLNELSELKAKTFISFDVHPGVLDVVVTDNTNLNPKSLRDTILIDLSEDDVTGAFPSASEECIMKQVPYPEFARERGLEGGVAVQFKFDDSGNIHVLESCSNSPELEQYVRTRLSSLQLKNCVADIDKDYYLRFMFRLF